MFFRTAAYLARSESSANREQKQIKRSLKFDFAEMQPILRVAKVVQGERKTKRKLSFQICFSEPQPILRIAKTAKGGGYGLEWMSVIGDE